MRRFATLIITIEVGSLGREGQLHSLLSIEHFHQLKALLTTWHTHTISLSITINSAFLLLQNCKCMPKLRFIVINLNCAVSYTIFLNLPYNEFYFIAVMSFTITAFNLYHFTRLNLLCLQVPQSE